VASEHTTDRFACFRVRVPRAARAAAHASRLTVGDRFIDPPATLVVKKPRRLCTPVATSGRPMRRATRHLLCHDVGPARAPHARAERVLDELATRTIELSRPDELCLLAEKNPPVAVHEDLTPCSATVDVWRFDARAGAPVDVDVDTTDATTAADLCAELSCEGLSVAGNDERTCTVAPPAHGCPRLHGVPTGEGACVVTVRTCGPCADAARAQYALRAAVGGEDAPTTLITDDAAVAP